MVAMSAFSGLVSSACALASAAAIAPIVSLDRCTTFLPRGEKIKTDRARFRSLGANAVAGGFLRVLRHQGFELGFGPFVVEKGGTGRAEEPGELRPRIGLAHIDDPNRFDPRPRRLNAIGARGLPGLDAAPEPALGGDQKVLVERVGGDGHFNPLAPPVMIESAAHLALVTHMLCCNCAICFSPAASSENDQGSMNLASNTASGFSTMPSRVAAIQRLTGC